LILVENLILEPLAVLVLKFRVTALGLEPGKNL
jgi:hypothetical protein